MSRARWTRGAVLLALFCASCVRFGFRAVQRGDSAAPARDGPTVQPDLREADGAAADSTPKDSSSPRDADAGPADTSRPREAQLHDERLSDKAVAADLSSVVPGTWISIPAGTFYMGSPSGAACVLSVEPYHQVTLTHAFAIEADEVTQASFSLVMGYAPSSWATCGTDCPVETVTWHEAAAYCNALSSLAKVTPCYSCTGTGSSTSCAATGPYSGGGIYSCPGYRLPTEAEWEYAYRAGSTTELYNGSMGSSSCYTSDPNADLIAWYKANSGAMPHQIRQKTPNAWTLYDIAGNVAEWTGDLQSSLSTSPATDPWGGSSGTWAMIRGGSWNDAPWLVRATPRSSKQMSTSDDRTGFRCVKTEP